MSKEQDEKNSRRAAMIEAIMYSLAWTKPGMTPDWKPTLDGKAQYWVEGSDGVISFNEPLQNVNFTVKVVAAPSKEAEMTPEEWEPENSVTGSGGQLLPDHVICPKCAHNFHAVSDASRDAIHEARNSALEEAAKVADARAAICRDAQKLGPETLPNVEIHTALEAEHIAAAIRGMIK